MNNLRLRHVYLINGLLWLLVFPFFSFYEPLYLNIKNIYVALYVFLLLVFAAFSIFLNKFPHKMLKMIRLISISLNIILITLLIWVFRLVWDYYSFLNITYIMIIFFFVIHYYQFSFKETLFFGMFIQISLLLNFPVFAYKSRIDVNSLSKITYIIESSIFLIYFFMIALKEFVTKDKTVKKNDFDSTNTDDLTDKHTKTDNDFCSRIFDVFVSRDDKQDTESMYPKIFEILKETGKTCGADRAYLFEIDSNMMLMSNTVEWCRKPVFSQQKYLQNIPVSDYPWWMNKLYNNEYIFIESIQNMPAEAMNEKGSMERQEIISFIVVGLYSNSFLTGFIGIDYVNPENHAKLKFVKILNKAGYFINELLKTNRKVNTFLSVMKNGFSKDVMSEIVFVGVGDLLHNIPCILVGNSGEIISMNEKGKALLDSANIQHENNNIMINPGKKWTILVDCLHNMLQKNIHHAFIEDFIFESNNAFYSVYFVDIFYQKDKSVILLAFIDITHRHVTRMELIKEVEEKKRMLSEIHHRVKNNMQIISNFMDLENLNINRENALSIFNDTRDRIKGLAILHEKLYESREFGKINLCVYLKQLVVNIILVLSNHKNIELTYSGEDEITAGFDTAITCGLLVNEIIVNSLKHAFTDKYDGNIFLKISKDQHDILLFVGDNGSGFDQADKNKSKLTLGLRLIEGFVKELNGSYEMAAQKGTLFTVRFPHVSQEVK